MKVRLIFFVILLTSLRSFSQNYDKAPIEITDIKKGINDVAYFRTVLLEKGFIFEKKQDEDEFWKVKVDEGSELDKKYNNQLAIQISNWKDSNMKLIFLQIRRDLLPAYNEVFLTLVKASFPMKKALPIKSIIKQNGKETVQDDYKLVYFNSSSKIEIEVEEKELWATYKFWLNTSK